MNKKNKWGRPCEMTEEKVKKLEEAFALDSTILEACFYANISKQTYYDWFERKPELVDRFEALRQKPILLARQSVIWWFKDSPELALKYLSKKRKDEFGERVELTGKDWWSVNIDVSNKALEFAKKNWLV